MEKRINVEQLIREVQKKIDNNYTSRNCKNTGTTFCMYLPSIYVLLSYSEADENGAVQ